jgi:pyruvate/2-oxoglutarate dehydrogenase complex dihydrolipoamide acyltransferase (E2) component
VTVRFALPDVGEGLHEAEIVRWLVAPGDRVRRDDPIVEILTDKAQVELPSPVAGVVRSLGPAEGTVVPVGTVLIEIDESGGATPGHPPATPAASADAVSVDAAPASTVPSGTVPVGTVLPGMSAGVGESTDAGGLRSPAARPKASPSTRKLAARLGVDLGSLTGTGPGGRILAVDVESVAARPTEGPVAARAAAASAAPVVPAAAPVGTAPPAGEPAGLGQMAAGTHPLRGVRRLTAAAMTRSWSSIPHITGMDEADATALLDARAKLRRSLADQGRDEAAAALTPLVLLAAAVARVLRRFPLVNASVSDDGATVTVYDAVHLGIAVATADGLIVPVVRDADRRDLVSLALEMQRLATAARNRTVRPDELRGGTFTLTNYGALGGRFATPLILPGQAGIMGFGAIRERAMVVDGAVVARPALPVVFSADHRIIDGDLSVAFQEAVLGIVAEPLTLLLGA